jgi:hypothetical protein
MIRDFNYQNYVSYFKKVGKYRGLYVIIIKAHICKIMRSNGYTVTKIGELLNMNHSSITHLTVRRKKLPFEGDFIKEHFNNCIENFYYPKTKTNKGYFIPEFKFVKL